MAGRNKWRTSRDVRPTTGLIGPNAILQLLPVLEGACGIDRTAYMMQRAGLGGPPAETGMIPEGDAARLHQQLRRQEPSLAASVSAEAGRRTADYILANRIPMPAQWVLKLLPPQPAAKVLSRAIDRHAWTFAGSGLFRVVDPWTFEITGNPLIRGEHSADCLCHWHAAVFARLFQVLVAPNIQCREVQCGACCADRACRFELRQHRQVA